MTPKSSTSRLSSDGLTVTSQASPSPCVIRIDISRRTATIAAISGGVNVDAPRRRINLTGVASPATHRRRSLLRRRCRDLTDFGRSRWKRHRGVVVSRAATHSSACAGVIADLEFGTARRLLTDVGSPAYGKALCLSTWTDSAGSADPPALLALFRTPTMKHIKTIASVAAVVSVLLMFQAVT